MGHTLGVIKGLSRNHSVFVFSSAMCQVLEKELGLHFQKLKVWPLFNLIRWRFWYLRWRLEALFSSFFFFFQILPIFKKHRIDFIYQRYSVLNCTGVLLSWYKKTPLILEYNGSEAYWFDSSHDPLW